MCTLQFIRRFPGKIVFQNIGHLFGQYEVGFLKYKILRTIVVKIEDTQRTRFTSHHIVSGFLYIVSGYIKTLDFISM